jgi:hypothetical protein
MLPLLKTLFSTKIPYNDTKASPQKAPLIPHLSQQWKFLSSFEQIDQHLADPLALEWEGVI